MYDTVRHEEVSRHEINTGRKSEYLGCIKQSDTCLLLVEKKVIGGRSVLTFNKIDGREPDLIVPSGIKDLVIEGEKISIIGNSKMIVVQQD